MMTLGNRIQQLRKEHNMSQGDLADALDISRQSVSKWETDTATPDLDKLLKLSELFQITLDELVKGKSESEEEELSESADPIIKETIVKETVPVEIKVGLEPRKIVGIILLCMAFFCALVCTVLGGFLEGLVFSLPFIICGVICLLVSKHTGLCCAWAINMMLYFFLCLASGASYNIVFHFWAYHMSNPLAVIIGWMHLIFIISIMAYTIRTFRNSSIHWNSTKQKVLLLVWLIYLLLHFPLGFIFKGLWKWPIILLSYIIGFTRIVLLTGLIICTTNWNRWRKSK